MAKGRFGNEYPNFQGPGKKGVSLSGMRYDEFLDRINRILAWRTGDTGVWDLGISRAQRSRRRRAQ